METELLKEIRNLRADLKAFAPPKAFVLPAPLLYGPGELTELELKELRMKLREGKHQSFIYAEPKVEFLSRTAIQIVNDIVTLAYESRDVLCIYAPYWAEANFVNVYVKAMGEDLPIFDECIDLHKEQRAVDALNHAERRLIEMVINARKEAKEKAEVNHGQV